MLPNLLASRRGRFAAFFALYVTEGIPLGFAAIAVATQLRRLGVGPAEIGAFVGAFYLPWAFKWAFGPLVDVIRLPRLGRRRGWIIVMQLMMAATLLALMAVPLPEGLALFTAILLLHNTCGAIQDVAIDALACNTLAEGERGLANGLMFAGAAIGQAIGGAGVLLLMDYLGFQGSFVFVAMCILLVTTFVALPLKEAAVERAAAAVGATGGGLAQAGREMQQFAMDAFRAFMGSRGAFAGVLFALLPAGSMALGLAMQSNLAVEFGMTDAETGRMNLAGNVTAAVSMVIGGWLSDRLGRQRTLLVYVCMMSLPALYLAWRLNAVGYVMPQPPGGAPRPELIQLLWTVVVAYNVCMGLMYGTRTAIFMDVTHPRVAATQFTAYMAMNNLAIAYSATWQGLSIEAFGYPRTLVYDAIFGLASLLVLGAMRRPDAAASGRLTDALAPHRARLAATVLALACLSWLAFWPWRAATGAAEPIIGTFYTLVFVGAALFLLAGRAILNRHTPPWWRGAALPVALALLLMYARKWLDEVPGGAQPLANALLLVTPLAAAVLLAWLARQGWGPLRDEADPD